jgi:F0F1-type ATP synthase epsilon subunit
MTVLADDAVFAEDIDASAARTELSAAEAQLRDLSPLEESFPALDGQRRWAQARIEAASAAR